MLCRCGIFVGVVALLCLQPGYADCDITPDASGHVNILNSVTSIGKAQFHSCSELKSITIPNSVTSDRRRSISRERPYLVNHTKQCDSDRSLCMLWL